jgi:hypothetical protein
MSDNRTTTPEPPDHRIRPMLEPPDHRIRPMLERPDHRIRPMLERTDHRIRPTLEPPDHRIRPTLERTAAERRSRTLSYLLAATIFLLLCSPVDSGRTRYAFSSTCFFKGSRDRTIFFLKKKLQMKS